MKPPNASLRVRHRLREELKARDISQRELADLLSQRTDEVWTQSKVQKVLTGAVELKIDDVDAMARAAGILLTEAVRDRGLEFYAEMTPTELRVLERLRQRPAVLHAIMVMLDIQEAPKPSLPVPKRPKRGRPLNSELAKR